MSKIQKALEMLRGNNEENPRQPGAKVSAEGNRTDRAEQQGGQSGLQNRSKARVRTRNLREGEAVDEKLPDFNISVNLEMLCDQGMYPRKENLDLIAQQFRRIKRPVLHTAFGIGVPDSKNANVIMLASALPKTGKTFCSFNLATSIARERDVGAVLVDADVLKPQMSHILGLKDRVGLIDYLLDASVTIDDILVGTDLYGIVVVPAGRQHEEATELLASRRMKKFVETLSERFCTRAIIVDTPPLLLTNEAHVLSEHMGQIVLVVEAGESSQESITQALNLFSRTKPINAILNKARSMSFADYSGQGYGYYSEPG